MTVFVHAVDTERNTHIPPGWRWAVHLGVDPHDLSMCLNAGWCPTQGEAAMEGEAVGTAVAKALRFYGHAVDYVVRHLEADPQPVI